MLKVSDLAPAFSVPAVGRDGVVSLTDYRGTPLLLVLNRGLWCTFCRRFLVQLGSVLPKVKDAGVELLVIIATRRESANFYITHRPMRVPLAADAEHFVHHAYGLTMPPFTPEIGTLWNGMRLQLKQTAFNFAEVSTLVEAVPTAKGDPDAEVPLTDLIGAQARLYPHELSQSETEERNRSLTLGTGQFLVDQQGIIRWARVQGVTDRPAGIALFPNEAELLAAVRSMVNATS